MTIPDISDQNEMIAGFSNINYLGPQTKNTMLHLFGYISTDQIDKNIDYLKNKMLSLISLNPNVINMVDNEGRNPLMVYIVNRREKLINMLIIIIRERSLKLDFSIKEKTGFTIMSLACTYSNQEAIISLMEIKCPFSISDISKISDSTLRENISKIFFDGKRIEYEVMEDSNFDFKIYNPSNFRIINDNIGSGTYGIAVDAIEIATGNKCILKKFKSTNSIKLDSDTLKDIMFLKSLNKKNNSVKIYGILTDTDDNFYLVIEKLLITLDDTIKAIYKILDNDNRHKQFLQLFKECLICIDNNSKAGIVHGDVKANNMMVDFNNMVKFIDYGFSSFLGVSPYIDTVNHTIHEAIYTSDDGAYNEDITIDYNLNGKIVTIKKGFYGENYDVVSIGLMFIQPNIAYKSYVSHEGELYFHSSSQYKKHHRIYSLDKNFNETLKRKFGDKVFQLIVESLDINPNIRKTAKELLNSPFFDTPQIVVTDVNITNITNGSIGDINKYNTLFQSNYKRLGYIYFDDIIKHYSDFTIELCHDTRITTELRIKCHRFSVDSRCSLDVYYNTLIFINRCVNDGISFFANNFHDRFYMIFMLATRFYSYVYMSDFIDDSDRYILSKINNKELYTQCYHAIRDCPYFYDLHPMMTFVGYIKFLLQLKSKDSALIYANCQYIVAELANILIKTGTDLFHPIRLIASIHDSNPNKIEI